MKARICLLTWTMKTIFTIKYSFFFFFHSSLIKQKKDLLPFAWLDLSFCFRPRDTNRFLVTINVAGHSEVKFDLRYQELLQRRLGFYEHPIYVDPGQPVNNVSIEVFIQESKKITFIHVPPLRPNDLSLPSIGKDDWFVALISIINLLVTLHCIRQITNRLLQKSASMADRTAGRWGLKINLWGDWTWGRGGGGLISEITSDWRRSL